MFLLLPMMMMMMSFVLLHLLLALAFSISLSIIIQLYKLPSLSSSILLPFHTCISNAVIICRILREVSSLRLMHAAINISFSAVFIFKRARTKEYFLCGMKLGHVNILEKKYIFYNNVCLLRTTHKLLVEHKK